MSERTYRLLLFIIGGGVIVLAFWGGMRAFMMKFSAEPVPPKARVRFDPNTGAFRDAQFSSLTAFYSGTVVAGAIGKPFPFNSGGDGARLLQGQTSPLSTLEEISLGGARAIDLSRSSDGSVLVLLAGTTEAGASYEIRSFAVDGSAETFSSWRSGTGDPSAVRLAAGSDGSAWIGGSGGEIGRCERGGVPTWFSPSETGLSGRVLDMSIDGAGRVWATDGENLALGGRDAFAPFAFISRLSAEDRRKIAVSATAENSDEDAVRSALFPRKFGVLSSGEMGLVTAHAALVFPLALQNSLRFVDVPASVVPLTFSPDGNVYGKNIADGGLVRMWATGTSAYATTALPRAARTAPDLFDAGPSGFFALDYVPTSTVLWTAREGEWTAEIVAASGTAPGDTALRICADGAGNIFANLKQGGLLRIRKGSAR
jgi:hypothetical protein